MDAFAPPEASDALYVPESCHARRTMIGMQGVDSYSLTRAPRTSDSNDAAIVRRTDGSADVDRDGKRGRGRGEAQTKEERVKETAARAERWARTIGVGATKAFMVMMMMRRRWAKVSGLAAEVLDCEVKERRFKCWGSAAGM